MKTQENTKAKHAAFILSHVPRLLSHVLIVVSCVLYLSSCKDKKETFTIDYHLNYAPVDSGHYVIYDVDSILYTYNGIQINDTAHYQLMEIIGDTFYDNVDGLCNELNLYRRENENAAWEFDRKWWIKRTDNTFLKNEGDLKFTKLIFPPKEGEEWNGNAHIPTTTPYTIFRDWEYIYADVGIPFSINGLSFDSTLTVSEVADTTTVINRKIRTEVYAKNVGMIYQHWESLSRRVISGDWQTDNMNGFRIIMRVREHN